MRWNIRIELAALFTIGVVLLTFALLLLLSPVSDHVYEYTTDEKTAAAVTKAQKFVDKLRANQHIREPITVKPSYDIFSYHNAGIMRDDDDRLVILIDPYLLVVFSEDAQHGILGHEVGHFLLGHVDSSHQRTILHCRDNEMLADAVSVKLTSEKCVRAFLKEFGENDERINQYMRIVNIVINEKLVF